MGLEQSNSIRSFLEPKTVDACTDSFSCKKSAFDPCACNFLYAAVARTALEEQLRSLALLGRSEYLSADLDKAGGMKPLKTPKSRTLRLAKASSTVNSSRERFYAVRTPGSAPARTIYIPKTEARSAYEYMTTVGRLTYRTRSLWGSCCSPTLGRTNISGQITATSSVRNTAALSR